MLRAYCFVKLWVDYGPGVQGLGFQSLVFLFLFRDEYESPERGGYRSRSIGASTPDRLDEYP